MLGLPHTAGRAAGVLTEELLEYPSNAVFKYDFAPGVFGIDCVAVWEEERVKKVRSVGGFRACCHTSNRSFMQNHNDCRKG